MERYYVYILECSDRSYCVGVTNNIKRRLEEHASGMDNSCYTYKRRPLKLVYQGVFKDVLQAIRWEKQIKDWSRKKKEILIQDAWEKLPDLSLNLMQWRIRFLQKLIREVVMLRTLET